MKGWLCTKNGEESVMYWYRPWRGATIWRPVIGTFVWVDIARSWSGAYIFRTWLNMINTLGDVINYSPYQSDTDVTFGMGTFKDFHNLWTCPFIHSPSLMSWWCLVTNTTGQSVSYVIRNMTCTGSHIHYQNVIHPLCNCNIIYILAMSHIGICQHFEIAAFSTSRNWVTQGYTKLPKKYSGNLKILRANRLVGKMWQVPTVRVPTNCRRYSTTFSRPGFVHPSCNLISIGLLFLLLWWPLKFL